MFLFIQIEHSHNRMGKKLISLQFNLKYVWTFLYFIFFYNEYLKQNEIFIVFKMFKFFKQNIEKEKQ